MSNAQQPKQPPGSPGPEQGQDEMKSALMGRAQEIDHIQARVASSSWSAEGAGAEGSEGINKGVAEKVGTFLPETEGGAWKAAATLRLASAAFAVMAVGLLLLPELDGTFEAPPPEVLKQPTYTVLTPTLDAPAPSEKLDTVITEQATSFDGASVLVVDSEPSGVSVEVDGNDQGGTPVSLTLDCLPGKPIRVEVFKRGYERARHTAYCRPDTMIKLFARLRKAGKK